MHIAYSYDQFMYIHLHIHPHQMHLTCKHLESLPRCLVIVKWGVKHVTKNLNMCVCVCVCVCLCVCVCVRMYMCVHWRSLVVEI